MIDTDPPNESPAEKAFRLRAKREYARLRDWFANNSVAGIEIDSETGKMRLVKMHHDPKEGQP